MRIKEEYEDGRYAGTGRKARRRKRNEGIWREVSGKVDGNREKKGETWEGMMERRNWK